MIKLLLPLIIICVSMVMIYLIFKLVVEISGIKRKKSSEEKELEEKLIHLSNEEIRTIKRKAVASKILNLDQKSNKKDKKVIDNYFKEPQETE